MKKFALFLAPLMAVSFLTNCGSGGSGGKTTKFYSFTFTGTHCSLNNESQYEEGSKIELTLTSDSDDYMIPPELDDIKMGGKKLVKDTDYSYNYRNGSLIIPSITGVVTVTANAVSEFNFIDFNMGSDYPIGANVPKFQKISSGDKVEMPNPSTYIAYFERNNYGHVFHHWATEPNGANSYDFNKPVNSSFTLYAVWDVKEIFKVSFNMNSDNYPSDAVKPAEQIVLSGSCVKEPKETIEYTKIFVSSAKNKFYFKHWSLSSSPDGEKYNFNTAINSSLTLYAIWDIKDPLTITFNKNTENYPADGAWLNESLVAYDEKVKAPTKEQILENFDSFGDKRRYSFKYWSKDPEGEEEYDFNSTVTNSFTLYANWDKKEACLVKFDMPAGYPKETYPWPKNQLVIAGGYAREPKISVEYAPSYTDSTGTNYAFMNWEYSDESGGRFPYDFQKEKVFDDLTIYPNYMVKPTLKFNIS